MNATVDITALKSRVKKYSYLVSSGLMDPGELKGVLIKSQKKRMDIEKIFLNDFGLSREEIGRSLENYYQIPYYGYNDSILLSQDNFSGLNLKFLYKNCWVPVQNDSNIAVVLIDDPMDIEKVHGVKQAFTKKEIQFRVGLKADIMDFLNIGNLLKEEPVLVNRNENVSSLLVSIDRENGYLDHDETDEFDDSAALYDSDNGIVRLVNKIIIDAYLGGVSDIHIEPGLGKKTVTVRFRKEGDCEIYANLPAHCRRGIVSRIKVMAKLDIFERRLPHDGKFKLKFCNKEIEVRVTILPTVGNNEDVVLRLLEYKKIMKLNEINFTPANNRLVKANLNKPYGLILVVGPTGSGKTTTLHSFLNYLNTPIKKIWTVEDPVEITQVGLRQLEVNPKVDLSFERAMRSLLRGDPDVIMIGEIRDVETCNIALKASLTGHLVLSTLHTNSAPETITRLLDIGTNPMSLTDGLILVVAQRLVRTLCNNCKRKYHPKWEEFNFLVKGYGEKEFSKLGIEYSNDLRLMRPVGCSKCGNTGYAGRTALHEALNNTSKIKQMILQGRPAGGIKRQAIKNGMTTLKQDGIIKIFQGICDFKQVISCGAAN